MALASLAGSSYRMRWEMIECRGVMKNKGMLKTNETNVGFCSSSRSLSKKMQQLQLGCAGGGSMRGHRLIVAASPPTEDLVTATEPLMKEDLVGYLASGCKTKENWRIGTEHEKFGFELDTLLPMKYDQIVGLLNGIAERFDWDKIMEGDKIIGLKQGNQSISLEAGGQFELSGAPLETLHQTCAEVNAHLYQLFPNTILLSLV